MKKNTPFSITELQILKGSYSQIARKHGVSTSYVHHIAKGIRKTKTEKAKQILESLKSALSIFRPV